MATNRHPDCSYLENALVASLFEIPLTDGVVVAADFGYLMEQKYGTSGGMKIIRALEVVNKDQKYWDHAQTLIPLGNLVEAWREAVEDCDRRHQKGMGL